MKISVFPATDDEVVSCEGIDSVPQPNMLARQLAPAQGPMRILCICSSWRVFGAETVTLKMLEGLKRNGHALQAVTSAFTDGEMSRRLAELAVPECVLPMGALSKQLALRPLLCTADAFWRLPALWWKFNRIVRRFRPDVLVLTGNKQALWLYPWLAAQPSFLIEYTNVAPSPANAWLYRTLAHKITAFVAVSQFMRRHLQRVGVPVAKIQVVRSGACFAADALAGLPPRRPRNQHEPLRVGIVGQVAPNKGHHHLVEALSLLRQRQAKVTVLAYGCGPLEYTQALKAKIQNAGLADLWQWMGYERDQARIFQSIDLCAVPSCFGDPFPTVAMEAGLYGLPVLATRQGGLPEIIEDGLTGWLVDANAPDQLADKIEWLLHHPLEGHAMGLAGRTRVLNQFTTEKMVAGFEHLFANSRRSRQLPCPS